MVQIKLKSEAKIWNVVSKDPLRHGLRYIYFDGRSLFAGDGRFMFRQDVGVDWDEGDELKPCLLPLDVVKEAIRGKSNTIEVDYEKGRATTFRRDGTEISFVLPEDRYPYEGVKEHLDRGLLSKGSAIVRMRLSADVLKAIVDALTDKEIKSVDVYVPRDSISKDGKTVRAQIVVESLAGFGVVMPVIWED